MNRLVLCAVFFCVALSGHVVATNNLRQTVVPKGKGICDSTVQQYVGYYDIQASTNKHYFFWAFESRGNPAVDPIVLWMTGGPGCSSDLAMLAENGPCKVNKDMSTRSNPYSWTNNATVIWIDQPAGVGFSYADMSGYDSNEAEVAADMYSFLQDFFKANTMFQGKPFYVFGESYGGHYAPATAHRVFVGNQKKEGLYINLQGLAIGNGLTDPLVQYQSYPYQGYNFSKKVLGHPSISFSVFEQMVSEWPDCQSQIAACQTDTSACNQAQQTCNSAFLGPYQQTGLNPYNMNETCEVQPLCYDFSAETKWLNLRSTQEAIGVANEGITWQSCNFIVNSMFSSDWMKNYQTQIPDLLANGTRVLVYSGDLDYIVNWIGGHMWTLAMKWPGQSAFKAAPEHNWNTAGTAAAVARTAKGLTFLQVHGAGHMVPMDQPEVAVNMLNHFTSGGTF